MIQTEQIIIQKAKSFEFAFAEVKNHVALKRKIRNAQEMLRDMLDKNEEYSQLSNSIKTSQRDQRSMKKRLLNSEAASGVIKTIESLKNELDTQQLSLFAALDEYKKETGQSRIIDEETKTKFNFVRKYKVAEEV